jgi:ubiquinone/menaquinone biosynthesis C-methylase UbiE
MVESHWDERWREAPPGKVAIPRHPSIMAHILSLLKHASKKRILEVGAGTGGDSIYLAEMGGDVYALDYSQSSLELIRKISKIRNVKLHLVKADARSLPFCDNFFDFIFSAGVMEHFKEKEIGGVLAEQGRVLNKGGFLLVDVPQRYCLTAFLKHAKMKRGEWPVWETDYSIDEMKRLIKASGLKIVSTYSRQFWPSFVWEADRIGAGLFGKPILPNYLASACRAVKAIIETSPLHQKMTKFSENWRLTQYFSCFIGVIGQKV